MVMWCATFAVTRPSIFTFVSRVSKKSVLGEMILKRLSGLYVSTWARAAPVVFVVVEALTPGAVV